jgi:serine protease Do
LERGDVIVAIDGRAIEGARELGFRVGTAPIGETRIIEYRRSAESLEARLELIAAPETVAREQTDIAGVTPLAGAKIANLSPAVAEELNLPAISEGVAIVEASAGPAARYFRKGDIIRIINGAPVNSVADVRGALAEGSRRWLIVVERNGQTLEIRLRG